MTQKIDFYKILLEISTGCGGIAAIFYFFDKFAEKKNLEEKTKVVDDNWWESSELKKKYESIGYRKFSWSNPERVVDRIEKGKNIVYEINEKSRTKYKLVNQSGQILICGKDH